MEDVRKQKKEEGMFKRGELLGQFTARKLFGWSDKGMMKNTGQGQKEIGDDGKEEEQEGKEPWRQ